MQDADTQGTDAEARDERPKARRAMDVVIEARPRSFLRRHWYLVAGLALLVSLAVLKRQVGSASFIARRGELKIAAVQRGDFAVNVRANGKLKSKQVYLLATRVSGSVSQVLLKAGDPVDVETPVVMLTNPQLDRDLAQARSRFKQISAERLVQAKALETLLLDEEIQLLTAKNNYQTAMRNLNAQVELSKYGPGLIAALDLQQSKASAETQQQILQLSEKRVAQLRERVEAQERAQSVELEQLQADVANVRAQIAQLVVRSSMKGTLQSVAVSPGQKLDMGGSVGVVADTAHLVAQLQVPELQVQQVAVGLPVTVDTRRSQVPGRVSRVAPSVEGGMVEVDVSLDGDVPPEARADLSVEGLIHVVRLQNVLYVDRPAFAQAHAAQSLYRLTDGGGRAARVVARLGEASVNQIQVVDGLQAGDQIIVSDTSAFSSHETVVID